MTMCEKDGKARQWRHYELGKSWQEFIRELNNDSKVTYF